MLCPVGQHSIAIRHHVPSQSHDPRILWLQDRPRLSEEGNRRRRRTSAWKEHDLERDSNPDQHVKIHAPMPHGSERRSVFEAIWGRWQIGDQHSTCLLNRLPGMLEAKGLGCNLLCKNSLQERGAPNPPPDGQEPMWSFNLERVNALAPGDSQNLTNIIATRRTSHQGCLLRTMDGASDVPVEQPVGTTTSLLDLQSHQSQLSKVRLLSDETLTSQRTSTIGEGKASEREPNAFTNPFCEDDGSRNSSMSSGTAAYLRPNAFAGHRDTLARLNAFDSDDEGYQESDTTSYLTALTRQQSTSGPYHPVNVVGAQLDLFFPQRIVYSVLKSLSFEDYKAIRLVCRRWYNSLPQPHFPGAYLLPREMLKLIYSYLNLCDFDAARHTCRSWFVASLDRKVLDPMLKSGACQSALASDISRLHGHVTERRRSWETQFGPMQTDCENVIDKEWVCSKRLATESRLSPNWRGSPFAEDLSPPPPRLSTIEEVDFLRILDQGCEPSRPRFTVSACGRFVLVFSVGDISVYSLCDPERTLVPVVRLATGIEVLRVSMDTSSERYSIAALLAGRIGMLWDLQGNHIQTRYRNNSGEPMNLGMQTDIQSSASTQSSRPQAMNLPMRCSEYLAAELRGDYDFGPATLLSATSTPGFVPSPPFS